MPTYVASGIGRCRTLQECNLHHSLGDDGEEELRDAMLSMTNKMWAHLCNIVLM